VTSFLEITDVTDIANYVGDKPLIREDNIRIDVFSREINNLSKL